MTVVCPAVPLSESRSPASCILLDSANPRLGRIAGYKATSTDAPQTHRRCIHARTPTQSLLLLTYFFPPSLPPLVGAIFFASSPSLSPLLVVGGDAKQSRRRRLTVSRASHTHTPLALPHTLTQSPVWDRPILYDPAARTDSVSGLLHTDFHVVIIPAIRYPGIGPWAVSFFSL